MFKHSVCSAMTASGEAAAVREAALNSPACYFPPIQLLHAKQTACCCCFPGATSPVVAICGDAIVQNLLGEFWLPRGRSALIAQTAQVATPLFREVTFELIRLPAPPATPRAAANFTALQRSISEPCSSAAQVMMTQQHG